jgi:hypothetical protein
MENYFGEWHWDDSEYDFFMSLGDVAKLEYVYDYFNIPDDVLFEFELDDEFDIDDEHTSSTSIDVVITDTHFLLTCNDYDIAMKTISAFQMDGYILTFDKKKGDTYLYKCIGMSQPLSVN